MDHHRYPHHDHDHDQYYHQMTLGNNHPYNTIKTTPQAPRTTSGSMLQDEQKMMTTRPQEPRNCPRCNSSNTKFCYYNNYSLSQPRYLCKSCRRYWTDGGSLRNVPVGGGSRKNKKLPLLLPNSSKLIPDLNPPFLFTSNPNNTQENNNNNDLSLSFSVPLQTQGHFTDNTRPSPSLSGGQNRLFTAPLGMIQFRQEYEKTNVGFSLDGQEEEIGNKDNHHHHQNLMVNEEGSKVMYDYNGDHMKLLIQTSDDDEEGRKKRQEGGSSNEIWSGIILGGDSGGPTW